MASILKNGLSASMNTQSINRFLGACGATGPLRLAAERPRVFGPVSVTLDKPFALIGSGVHADLRLDDNQVSHRHLYFQVYNGRVFGIDLGSRTGTHWENGRQPFGWLDVGKSLWIGRHRVYLADDSPGSNPIRNCQRSLCCLEISSRQTCLRLVWSSSKEAFTRGVS